MQDYLYLDISKSREIDDEGSLIILAKALETNVHLEKLDLSGVRVRKVFLKQYLEPILTQNITIKTIITKLAPEIDEQLRLNRQI